MGEPSAARTGFATAVWLVCTVAGTAAAAYALPEVVSTGACSTSGQLSGGNRAVARCTDEQVRMIVTLIVGTALVCIGLLGTMPAVRGRAAIVSRLVGGGVAALVVGLAGQLELRDPEVVASMTPQDLDGWRIGLLPLVIGGPVCLLVAVIILAVRLRRARS